MRRCAYSIFSSINRSRAPTGTYAGGKFLRSVARAAAAYGDTSAPPPSPPGPARAPVHAEIGPNGMRIDVQELMFAAGEMQISGEPFAQFFAGRNLNDYDRTYLPTDMYIVGFGTDAAAPVKDLFGFATAVE